MFHGIEPFDENNKDHQIRLKVLQSKAKNKNIYYAIINTWTNKDPNKRKIAKNNKLNYLEFWKEKEVYNWLLQFKEEIYKCTIIKLNIKSYY